MIRGARWHMYGVVTVFFILTLALFWLDISDRDQHPDILADTVNKVSVSAREPGNFFANDGVDPSLMEPTVVGQPELPVTPETEAMPQYAIGTNTVSNDPPASTSKGTTADWNQWRKADERLRSYLGEPPGPGKPAEN